MVTQIALIIAVSVFRLIIAAAATDAAAATAAAAAVDLVCMLFLLFRTIFI